MQLHGTGAQQQAPTQHAQAAVQHQQPSYHQQPQQQQLQQPQVSISPQHPQVAVTPQQHIQQEEVVNYSPQQPREASVPQYVVDRQSVSVATHPSAAASTVNPGNVTQQVPAAEGHVFIQPAQPTAVPVTVQAEVYTEKIEEGAGSSDGGNNTDDTDGKRRRNKKRRDPNYYKNFYTNPALYNSQDNAYYADNESSSGSSGNTSEVHVASQETMPDSVIIDMTQMEPNLNMTAQGAINQPHVAPHPVVPVHMQQQQVPVNRTSGMHHGGYVAHPQYISVQDGATVMGHGQTLPVSGQPPPQSGQPPPPAPGGQPPPPGPPGLQHSAAAAAAAAIQLQKSPQPHVMPATTNVQNIVNYKQRTIQPEQAVSAPPTGDATKLPQSMPPKTQDSVNVPTVQRYVFDTTKDSNTLNAAVMQNLQQETTAPNQQQRQSNPVNVQTSLIPPQVAPVDSEVSPATPSAQASLPAPVSSPPHASASSTSASPGSTTPIASPMTTPVASPQPPAVSLPSSGVPDIVTSSEVEPAAAETLPAAESAPAAAESTPAVAESAPAAADEQSPANATVPEPAAAPAPASAWGKPTSWAGLFKSSSTASAPLITTTPCNNSTADNKGGFGSEQQNDSSHVSPDDDPRAKELAGKNGFYVSVIM